MNTSENFKIKAGILVVPALMSLLFLALTFSSCKKTGPTNATVYIKDSIERPIANVTVTLWQDTSVSTQSGQQSNIRVTKNTDPSGRADFEFSLEAYLNIEAVKNGDTARGFIRLKEHETVEKTLHLY
jgi:hypothetical protein